MTINQAFEILKNAGDIRAARIITDHLPRIGRIRLWFIARALRRGMPVAKIIHEKWFYGLPFYTNRHTLDPRPDTETLVSAVISDNATAPTILDIGTGTGCILISIVKNMHNATGVGVDISNRAIRVARRNVKKLGLRDKVQIVRGSFNNKKMVRQRFDIIVSNPPYIAIGDRRVNAGAMHDPRIALYAAHNGMAAYEQIATNGQNWIKPNGKLYLEIGAGEKQRVKKIFESAGWTFVRDERDLGGIIRVLVFAPANW